ncbi:MAG TPA: hypothetical protein ENJ95_24135 [Bacteroidetes bacterium]|nr:hypothetical protein [Bacteroidota bacterium]
MKTHKTHPSSNHPHPDFQFKTKDGKPFDVPVEGSLGLLALGDIGLIAWRQKRRQFKEVLATKTRRHFQNEGL